MTSRITAVRAFGALALTALVAAPLALVALTVPNTFTNGTVASADAMNANFAAVGNELTLAMKAEHGTWQKTAGLSGFVPYFTTQYANTLSTLGTVTNDATNGWSFTPNRKVKVTMHVTLATTGGGGWHSITINGDKSTAMGSAANLPKVVASEYENISTGAVSIGWAGILQAGDVIRPHDNQGAPTTGDHFAGVLSILVEPVN